MKPSSLRTRAIATFSLEAGTLVKSCLDEVALRMRVSMSAMGSVTFMAGSLSALGPEPSGSPSRRTTNSSLPARLLDARQLTLQGQPSEADAAEGEEAHVRPRPPAKAATVLLPRLVLGRPLRPDDLRCLGHATLLPSSC